MFGSFLGTSESCQRRVEKGRDELRPTQTVRGQSVKSQGMDRERQRGDLPVQSGVQQRL